MRNHLARQHLPSQDLHIGLASPNELWFPFWSLSLGKPVSLKAQASIVLYYLHLHVTITLCLTTCSEEEDEIWGRRRPLLQEDR